MTSKKPTPGYAWVFADLTFPARRCEIYLGEEKPEEALMGNLSLRPRLPTTALAVANLSLTFWWKVIPSPDIFSELWD